MERIRATTLFLYHHHFVRYLAVGGTSFILDFGTLFILHGKLAVSIAIATSIAYCVSIVYNFTLTRYWTFDAREKDSLQRHFTTYCCLLVINYIFVVVFVSLASRHINYLAAKTISVVFQVTWNYPVYKKVIFVPVTKDA